MAGNFVSSCQTVSGLPGNAVFAKLHLSISSAMFKNYTGWVCILWAMAFSSDAIAQAGADTLIRNHWELGVDVLSLFDKNNVPAATIFARYNYRQRLAKGRAWRFRVGVDSEMRDYSDVTRFFTDTWRGYGPYLSIGHEWQFQFRSESYQWFVGGDISGQYSSLHSFTLLSIADSTVVDTRLRDITTRVSAIAGFKYSMTKHLSVSIESAFNLTYKYMHFDQPESVFGQPPFGISYGTDKKFITDIQPFWTINLTYQFNIRHEKNKN
ncbi:MAG: hypothetical protein IPJ82_20695 [Lewinellaceae bacterium]|nr:hypothetical protein [Lewinellaceae bacterium]